MKIRVVLTNKCQLRCIYCSGEGVKRITLSKFKQELTSFKEVEEVCFTGGEPTLSPYLHFLHQVCETKRT